MPKASYTCTGLSGCTVWRCLSFTFLTTALLLVRQLALRLRNAERALLSYKRSVRARCCLSIHAHVYASTRI